MIEVKFVEQIAAEISSEGAVVSPAHVEAALHLLESGATISFIARYRKDAVGGLDESRIEKVFERGNYFIGVTNRQKAIVEALAKEDKLTDELRARIESCTDKAVLEDLYLPFKAKRRTKATMAEEQGLAPLADFIMKQLPGLQTIEEFAEAFINSEKSISSAEEALEGVRYILTERFSMDADLRAAMRNHMMEAGALSVRGTKNAEGGKSRYEAFHNVNEPLAKVAAPRILAILRGVKEGFLRADIAIDDVQMFNVLLNMRLTDPASPYGAPIRLALSEAYARHLRPTIENEVFEIVRKRADDEVIHACREAVATALLYPPAGRVTVMGAVAPSKEACTIAVVDGSGQLLEHQTLAMADEASPEALGSLVLKHGVATVAVGTGGHGREASKWINGILAKWRVKSGTGLLVQPVNAGPASAHAGSRAAREEYPDADEAVRESIAIARRIQDPLAELVKEEPRSIGLGPHQYDVNQKQLREGLVRTVVSCVNQVGADLNAVPVSLLRYISGIQMGTAQNIVDMRQKLDGFRSRAQLAEVDGIGPKVLEQCAGFLRIAGGDQPLDATAIHPEAYPIVEQIAQSVGLAAGDLVGNAEALSKIDFAAFQNETYGPMAMADIRNELAKPGADSRGQFRFPRFNDDVAAVEDLAEGTETAGVVTNITDFGAFVDVGVLQDGLVHLSELSTRFVKNPREVIHIGDIVRVKVIKVDKQGPRISLSVKALLARPKRRPAARAKSEHAEAASEDAPKADGHPRRPSHGPAEAGDGRSRTRPPAARKRSEGGGEEARQPRAARPERRDRDRDRDREPRHDRRGARAGAGKPGARDRERLQSFGDTAAQVNTLLADQLAALREKFKP